MTAHGRRPQAPQTLLDRAIFNGHTVQQLPDIITVTVVCTICHCEQDVEGLVAGTGWFDVPCTGIPCAQWSDTVVLLQNRLLDEAVTKRNQAHTKQEEA